MKNTKWPALIGMSTVSPLVRGSNPGGPLKQKDMKPNKNNFSIIMDGNCFSILYLGYHICDIFEEQDVLTACGTLYKAQIMGNRLIKDWLEEWPNTKYYPKINEIHIEIMEKVQLKKERKIKRDKDKLKS